jgi:hypothetical protein
MKSHIGITIIVVLFSAAIIVLLTHHNTPAAKEELPKATAATPTPLPQSMVVTNRLARFPGNLRAADMTPAQRANLAIVFTNELKPALRKWSTVYQGRLPFSPDDLRVENFKCRLGFEGGSGSLMYAFVTDNGTTLTIAEKNGNAYVMQMMAKDAASSLNTGPEPGSTPNISVPITKDQVINWVKDDTGAQFPPSEVVVRPTGAATSIQGGAFVDLGGNSYGPQAYQFTGTNVQFVFGPDGMIINYERDPSL